jgi:predicted peptidase
MKSVLMIAIAWCALLSCKKTISTYSLSIANDANAYDTTTETALPTYKYIYTAIGSDVRSGYAEVLPSLYYKTTKRYPLIVFNHGIGENGNTGKSLAGVGCCGLPYWAKNGKFPARFYNPNDGRYYSYIVVAPQYYNRPTGAQVNEVVQYAMNKYRVDPSRVYVVGLSQGGGVTMDWATNYGEKAAAIFPSCPGLSPTDARARAIATKNLPIWWTYGTGDNLVPPSQGYTWQNLIDQYNPTYASRTKLTVWSGLSHNSTWWKAFDPATKVDGKNAYEWLLLYSRQTSVPGAPVATINNGDAISIPVSWDYMPYVWGTQSKDTDGGWIAKFNWSKVSGGACTINTPTSGSTKITGLVAGTYVFRLTVTDNDGKTATDDIKITMTND